MFNLFLAIWFVVTFVGGLGGLVALAWNGEDLPTAIGLPFTIWTLGGFIIGGFWATYRDNKNSKGGAELDKAKYVIGRFEKWYSDNGCPMSENDFCPHLEEKREKHDKEMAELDEDERVPFDPTEECEYEIDSGWCYARYYEKIFDDLKGKKGSD